MTDREVCAFLGISLSTLPRWRQDGNAPPHYQVGERTRLTKRSDVEAWLAERLVRPEARSGGGVP